MHAIRPQAAPRHEARRHRPVEEADGIGGADDARGSGIPACNEIPRHPGRLPHLRWQIFLRLRLHLFHNVVLLCHLGFGLHRPLDVHRRFDQPDAPCVAAGARTALAATALGLSCALHSFFVICSYICIILADYMYNLSRLYV